MKLLETVMVVIIIPSALLFLICSIASWYSEHFEWKWWKYGDREPNEM